MAEEEAEVTEEVEVAEEVEEVEGVEPEGGDDGDRLARVRREAAGYRSRLREVEAERDGLAATVRAMRRAELARLAVVEHGFADGDDLVAAVADVDALLGEDGTLDAEKVTARAVELLGVKPHYRAPRRPPARPRPAGSSETAPGDVPGSATRWRDALTAADTERADVP